MLEHLVFGIAAGITIVIPLGLAVWVSAVVAAVINNA